MSLFSIETLYFLSLGVIGCLILLLIIHFRNKLLHLESQVHNFHTIAKDLISEMKQTQLSYAAPRPQPLLDNLIVRKCCGHDHEDEEDDEDEDEDEDDEDEDEEDDPIIMINLGETVAWTDAEVIDITPTSGEVEEVTEKVDSLRDNSLPDSSLPDSSLRDNSLRDNSLRDNSLCDDDMIVDDDSVDEEKEQQDSVDLHKLTVQQLRQLGLERGIVSVNQKLKKQELLELLLSNK